jgi:hypothetical protein
MGSLNVINEKPRLTILLYKKKLLVMKIHVPILNKVKSTSLEVYN